MTDLTHALTLVRNRDNLQSTIETTLKPALQGYLDFLPQRGSSWAPHYNDALEYTFTELDGKNFIFQGEEYYQYGEPDTPYVSLPFDFVDDPETYKARILDEIKAAEYKRKIMTQQSKAEQVAKLRAQLERAEASLAKLDPEVDPIKATATQNLTNVIKNQIAADL